MVSCCWLRLCSCPIWRRRWRQWCRWTSRGTCRHSLPRPRPTSRVLPSFYARTRPPWTRSSSLSRHWRTIKAPPPATTTTASVAPAGPSVGANRSACSPWCLHRHVAHRREYACGHYDKRPHHVVVLVLEQVTVVHVAAGVTVECEGDRDQLSGIDSHRVLPARFIRVERSVAHKCHGRGCASGACVEPVARARGTPAHPDTATGWWGQACRAPDWMGIRRTATPPY